MAEKIIFGLKDLADLFDVHVKQERHYQRLSSAILATLEGQLAAFQHHHGSLEALRQAIRLCKSADLTLKDGPEAVIVTNDISLTEREDSDQAEALEVVEVRSIRW